MNPGPYCWLRDAFFTLGGLRRLGQFEEMEQFVMVLTNIAEASAGKLQPVYGISGERNLHEVMLEHLAGFRGNAPVRTGNAAFMQTQHDGFAGNDVTELKRRVTRIENHLGL